MLEGTSVTLSDEIGEADMVSEGGQPELGDGGGVCHVIFGKRGILVVIFDRIFLPSLYFFRRGFALASYDGISALVQRSLQVEILRTKNG